MKRMAFLLVMNLCATIVFAETWVTINNEPMRLKKSTSCSRASAHVRQTNCDCCMVQQVDVLKYNPTEAALRCREKYKCQFDQTTFYDLHVAHSEIATARSRLKSMTIVNINATNRAPDLPHDGVLTKENIVDIMQLLSVEGLLNLPTRLFEKDSDLSLFAKPLGDTVKGVFSGQLFFVGYKKQIINEKGQTEQKNVPLYILKETKKGISEIDNLYHIASSRLKGERINTYDKHFGEHKEGSATIAHIAFDDLHFKLKTNGQMRYFSLLQTAPGKSLNKHLRDFGEIAQRYETEDEQFRLALIKMKHIFYRIGFSMSELHQKYADTSKRRQGPLKLTLVHGDLHSENVFYDEVSDTVTLIDNETFALSLNRPSLGVDDLVEFYMLHTVKTIAHTVTSQLTNNREFGINDGLWHELWRSLFDGYIAAFGKLSEIEFEQLYADFRMQFYKGMSQIRIFKNPRNFADQRKLKRFGPSLRRRKIMHEELAETFDRLHTRKLNEFKSKSIKSEDI